MTRSSALRSITVTMIGTATIPLMTVPSECYGQFTRVGDALAPGAIAHAVYSGHRYAREIDTDESARALRRDAPLRTA